MAVCLKKLYGVKRKDVISSDSWPASPDSAKYTDGWQHCDGLVYVCCLKWFSGHHNSIEFAANNTKSMVLNHSGSK
jgi:hypothetical protein